MSNLVMLFQSLPTATIVAFLVSTVIPYLSALATKAPTWATGAVTVVLSALSGFLAEWSAAGSGFDWKAAAGTSLINLLVALVSHKVTLTGTTVEGKLHAVGNKAA